LYRLNRELNRWNLAHRFIVKDDKIEHKNPDETNWITYNIILDIFKKSSTTFPEIKTVHLTYFKKKHTTTGISILSEWLK